MPESQQTTVRRLGGVQFPFPSPMPMPMPRARTRWSALAASALIQCCAGSSYCFGVYSQTLKASQRYDQFALDAVAFFKDVGANAGVLSGFLVAWAPGGRRRPWIVLLAGSLLCAAGYLPMWLAVAGVAPAPLPLVCLYMLLAAQAQTFFNTADVVSAVENFPDRRGTVIGIMKAGQLNSFSLPIISECGREDKIETPDWTVLPGTFF